MAQRLSLGAFAVHGLEIKPFQADIWPLTEKNNEQEKICLGEFEKKRLKQSYWTELSSEKSAHSQPEVIHYTHPQAGVVAITVNATDQSKATHYPITAQGLTAIEKDIRHQLGEDYVTINLEFASHAQQLLWHLDYDA